MADRSASRNVWSGLLIPDPRVVITVSDGVSAGAHVGPVTADPENDGDLVLRSLRSERASHVADVSLEIDRGGQASTSAIPASCKVTVGTGQAMGHMDPTCLWGWSYVGSGTDGQRISRWGGLEGWSRDPVRAGQTADGSSLISERHDMCPRGDGEIVRVWVEARGAVYVIHTDIFTEFDVGSYERRSQVIDPTVLAPAIETDQRVAVAFRGSLGLLILKSRDVGTGDYRDHLHQFASDDGGSSWKHVGSSPDDEVHGLLDVTATNDEFVVGYVNHEDDKYTVRITSLASPWEIAWNASYETVASGDQLWDDADDAIVGGVEACLTDAEDGTIYGFFLSFSTTADDLTLWTWCRRPQERTWRLCASGSPSTTIARWDRVASDRPNHLDAVWCQGRARIVLVHAAAATIALDAGGFSSVGPTPPVWELGSTAGSSLFGDWMQPSLGWRKAWIGSWSRPTDQDWSAAGTITGVEGAGSLTLTGPGGGGSRHWSHVVSTTDQTTQVAVCKWGSMTDEAVSVTAPVMVRWTVGDGVAVTRSLLIGVGDDGVEVYRRTGMSTYTLVDTASHPFGGSRVEWYMHLSVTMSSGAFVLNLYARLYSDTPYKDDWQAIVSSSYSGSDSLGNIFADVTTAEVMFGSTLSAGAETKWADFSHCGPQLAAVSDIPDRVPGRSLSGSKTWLPADVIIQAGGGKLGAAVGDEYVVSTAYDHGSEALSDPNPGRRWRRGGEDKRDEAQIVATWGDAIVGPLLGVCLKGLIAEDVVLELSADGGSTWDEIEVERWISGLNAVRDGQVLRPFGSQTKPINVRQAEFAGSYVQFEDQVGRVTQCHQGRWSPSANTATAVLVADVSGSSDATGAVKVLPKDLCVIVHVGHNNTYDRLRLTLSAETATWPADQGWELGRLLVGPVHLFADETSWGGSISTDVTVDDGASPGGRVRPRALAPARRTVDLSWTDGIDTTRSADTSTPDSVSVEAGADPVSMIGMTPWQIQGLLRQIDGAAGEVVYVTGIPMTGGLSEPVSSFTCNRYHQFIHGRIRQSSVQLDSVQGDEGVDEVIRVGQISIVEEV